MSANSSIAKFYLEALEKRYPNVEFSMHDAQTIIALTNSWNIQISLDNLLRDAKNSTGNLEELIEPYLKSLDSMLNPKQGLDLNRIVPIIKPKKYLEEVETHRGINSIAPRDEVYEFYNDELLIVYAEDLESSIRYLRKDEILNINFQESDLKALAIQNLDRMLTSIKKKGADGIYFLIAGGDYEASIILIEDILSKENFDIDGDIVISIPNRDMLLITGSNDVANIKKIKNLASNTYNNGSHNLSPYLFIWNGEKFIKFDSIFE